MIYTEYVNFNFFILILKLFFLKKKDFNISYAYYIYSDNKLSIFYIYLLNLLNINVKKLDFKMVNMRDDKDHFINLMLPRHDLFSIEKRIKNNFIFKKIDNYNFKNNIKNYILKGIITESYNNDSKSMWRMIYLINVVGYDKTSKINLKKYFVINKRPWNNELAEYAKQFEVKLIQSSINFNFKIDIKHNFIFLAKKIINFYYTIPTFLNKPLIRFDNVQLYCEGKNEPNLLKNGERSDFFWLINSEFNPKRILYNCSNEYEVKTLSAYGINTTRSLFIKHFFYNNLDLKNISSNHLKKYKLELLQINDHLHNYQYHYNKWYNYFKSNNVKVFFSYYKYDNNMFVVQDVLNTLNGISCLWQMNFDGTPNYESKIHSDISFNYSLMSAKVDLGCHSSFKYQIITGYPTNYVTSETRKRAKDLRNKLIFNGAKKIICVLDENSGDDSRWNVGHELQRENYSFIIEELLKNKNMGLIFKPKSAHSLRKRLGNINQLLIEAEKTGRCYVYEDLVKNFRQFTKATPVLAALSADLVVHGHLAAGTAAIECALEKIPCILIDREICSYNFMKDALPKDKIVFENWSVAIEAINNHLFNNMPIDKFGDWSNYIKLFDPFLDNAGSKRIGNFLKDLTDGYDKGLSKNEILEITVKKYAKKWGKDKVIRLS